ncbi:hypothetical protein [Nitratireductor sp. StC3]|uniref:hypothetical protein n=1 Tax=Nitratireductor sp. StC3 TaxID=2126741 RepID=UPI000D0E2DA7|nr:hypothetical protein [Nitratireductor sp. StC3]PSM19839.1 hypothetical protein C7T96_01845 [Nitratireductor sp. StC3]
MRGIAFVALLATIAVSATSARGQTLPPIVIEHTVEGIRFATPITVQIDPANDQAVPFTARAQLDEFIGVLNTLANRHAGGDISHTGTQLWAEAGLLKVKVHVRYDGGFLGSTNGSVVALFQAAVTDNTVSLSSQSVELNISNDAIRIGSDLSGFRDEMQAQILNGLNKALSTKDAVLALPEEIQSLGISLDGAHFESRDGGLFAVLSGTLPLEIRVSR